MPRSTTGSQQAAPFRILALATLLTLALLSGVRMPVPPDAAPLPAPSAQTATPAGEVTGAVPFGRIGCLACGGLLLGAAGGSVLGVVAVLATWPEYGFWCGFGCIRAFR